MADAKNSDLSIVAEYRHPAVTTNAAAAETFAVSLPPLPTAADDVTGKTQYLSALRTAVLGMQEDVNTFLTKKMEEDKAAESAEGNGKKRAEEKEEEMYGEEDPENDG